MTTTEIATTTETGIALQPGQGTFTPAQVAVLKTLGVTDATEADLQMYAHVCDRLGLNPFARQIYMINRRSKGKDGKYENKQTVQVGIDGFRLVGRRVAEAAGETVAPGPMEWCGSDGKWVDVWLAPTAPAAARVTIVRGGIPWSGTVLWAEYAPTYDGRPSGQWASKPAHMLAKCAEALAYRRAFPQDLSGVYTPEELAQSDQPVKVTATRSTDAVDAALGIVDEAPAEIAPADPNDLYQLIPSLTTKDELLDVWPLLADRDDREVLADALRARAIDLGIELK